MPAIQLNWKRLKDTPPWEWPEDAGAMLLIALRDAQLVESDLLLAVELAGELVVIDDELVDALLAILCDGDQPEIVRGTAAIALGPVLAQMDNLELDDVDDRPITEAAFDRIRESLHTLYQDVSVPESVRRCALEASVRTTENWHQNGIRAALARNDEGWRLTAVFCMRFVGGFEDEILANLKSTNPDIHYEAVLAASAWGIDAAWPHVAALISSDTTSKPLLLAAIDAVIGIRPHLAPEILDHLATSDDEDIAAAVQEALDVAAVSDEDDFDDDDDGKLLH